MPNYLLEIGTEELPANFVTESMERLQGLMAEALSQVNLSCDEICTLGTPRRLAMILKGLSAVQTTTQKKIKGPPVKSSFSDSGQALAPAIGFAQRNGLKLEELDKEEIGGALYLVANLTVTGKPAGEVLKDIVPRVVSAISGERLMRWGDGELKFSRPIRWLVSLLGEEEVTIKLDGLKSGRYSYGHRILAPGRVSIRSSTTYLDDLRAAYVLVDGKERAQVIEREVCKAAKKVAGQPRQLGGSLLSEVVNITEWPSAILGTFADEYLELPDTLIETVMVHHQRYFPVEKKVSDHEGKAKLLPYFVSVANNDRDDAYSHIKMGNERVLRARLADGRFFFFDDQRVKLTERKEALGQLTFQEGLGTFLNKQERLVHACRILTEDLRLDAKIAVCLERTLDLCKLDLVTNLVRELPELQGYVGSWYAQIEGEPPDVVRAIASHYSPRSVDDLIPDDVVGRLASVIDKIDNLVAIFALGKRPSGSSDPYALRRQAQGAIDVLIDGLAEFPVNITLLIDVFFALLEPWLEKGKRKKDQPDALGELREFLLIRLRTKLLDMGFARETTEAVLLVGDPLRDLTDVVKRVSSLEELISTPGGLDLVRAGVRVSNILTAESKTKVDVELFEDSAEKILFAAFQAEVVEAWQKGGPFKQPSCKEEYKEMLHLLQHIAPLVDQLFDKVMINDPDKNKRDNRHALLFGLNQYFKIVADFRQLQPLLP